jgi:hypothetical protein
VGGNRCAASVRVDKAAIVTVSFAWQSTPTADDREEWSFTILAGAIHGTLEEAFRHRAVIEMLRQHVAAGALERAGIDASGDWLFGGTDAATVSLPPGVVSLLAKRQERRSRGKRGQHRLRP